MADGRLTFRVDHREIWMRWLEPPPCSPALLQEVASRARGHGAGIDAFLAWVAQRWGSQPMVRYRNFLRSDEVWVEFAKAMLNARDAARTGLAADQVAFDTAMLLRNDATAVLDDTAEDITPLYRWLALRKLDLPADRWAVPAWRQTAMNPFLAKIYNEAIGLEEE